MWKLVFSTSSSPSYFFSGVCSYLELLEMLPIRVFECLFRDANLGGKNRQMTNFLSLCLFFVFVACMAGYHEKRLLHDLLDSYNTLERPVVNESDPLQLSFGLTLMQIIDVVSMPSKSFLQVGRRTNLNRSRPSW